MTSDDASPKAYDNRKDQTREETSRWFSVPQPIRRVFDRFPLITYPPNELPRSSPRKHTKNQLYIFTTPNAARKGAPSFNPACLKWQAFLRFSGIGFMTVPSNNHASPTGALPFILRTSPSDARQPPVPSNKIYKWVNSQTGREEEPLGMRFDAYSSLLDHRIRAAWLHALYLDEMNFHAVARRLYIENASSHAIVQATMSYQLKQAAKEELLKFSTYIDEADLYVEAGNAFAALSTILGDQEFFFGQQQPGLFDASVFAYTYLLLDETLRWQNKRLANSLRKRKNLVAHRDRLFEKYFKS